MEAMVKKYQQKFRKVRDEMSRWDDLQSRLLAQFRNASSIIERLQVIQDSKYYGSLKCIDGIGDAVLGKQMESLETILLSMKKTMEELRGIVLSLEKILRDGGQLVKGGSTQPTMKQLQQRVGVKPRLADCLDGLRILHEMHHSEYLLKTSLVSALSALTLKPRLMIYEHILPIYIAVPVILVLSSNSWLISLISPKRKCNSSLKSYLQKKSVKSFLCGPWKVLFFETQKHCANWKYPAVVWVMMAASLFLAAETTKECLQRALDLRIFVEKPIS